jgi:hypothetical protein
MKIGFTCILLVCLGMAAQAQPNEDILLKKDRKVIYHFVFDSYQKAIARRKMYEGVFCLKVLPGPDSVVARVVYASNELVQEIADRMAAALSRSGFRIEADIKEIYVPFVVCNRCANRKEDDTISCWDIREKLNNFLASQDIRPNAATLLMKNKTICYWPYVEPKTR